MAKCKTCQSPLHIVSGGQKVVGNKIIMVQILGCLNPNCTNKMIEQSRNEFEVETFKE